MNKIFRETTIPGHERPDLSSKEELAELVTLIHFARVYPGARDTLRVLHEGPAWYGNLPSKAECRLLLHLGACVSVTVNGQTGYRACTNLGADLHGIYEWLYDPVPGRERWEARP